MIAFLAYLSAISLLLVAAAAASEPLLRALRQPTRFAWLATVFGAPIIAALALWTPSPTAPSPAAVANVSHAHAERGSERTAPLHRTDGGSLEAQPNNAIVAAGESTRGAHDATLIIATGWLAGSLTCLGWLLAGAWRIGRLRRSCRAGQLCSENVLVSDDVGPAVLGVLRLQVVIPAWVLELENDAQRLVIAHEREHVRARDPLVLHAVLLLIALMPWNIAAWYALHRLRAAIEIDCDARVLRGQRPATREYCRLLLDVGERTVAAASPLLALAEPATLLERRIESMTTTRKLRDWKTLMPAVGAVLLLTGACRTPRPEIAPVHPLGMIMRALSSATSRGAGSTSVRAVTAPIAAERAAPAVATQPATPSVPASAGSSRAESSPPIAAAKSPSVPMTDTTVRNEEALRRSAAEHQAHIDALADSVILASYPELTRRPPGTPAFLALVLDDRGKVMRHAVSLDPALPNDLAAIMLALHVDTISGRTIGLGISSNNPWNVTVGHAVEMLGPPRGRSEMRVSMTSPRPYALRRVPYQRIVDSVARARTPEAYQEHGGTVLIAMLLDEAGNVMRYGAEAHADTMAARVRTPELMNRLVGDSTGTRDIAGVVARLRPSRTTIVWGVRRLAYTSPKS